MTIARAFITVTLVGTLAACGSSAGPAAGVAEDGGSAFDAQGGAQPSTSDGGGSEAPDASGGASTPTDGGGATDSGVETGDTATVTVNIPSTVTGAPTNLVVALVPSIPVSTIPMSIYSVKNPKVTPGQPFIVNGNYLGISGTYYVLVVLYMPGGGAGVIPVNGTDYEGASSTSFTFSSGPVNLGTVSLALAEADAGL
jgi:hypothetical protein